MLECKDASGRNDSHLPKRLPGGSKDMRAPKVSKTLLLENLQKPISSLHWLQHLSESVVLKNDASS